MVTPKQPVLPPHIETIAVHAGETIDPATRASSPNLVMSATFAPTEIPSFSAKEIEYDGFVYARVGSPTVRQLEVKLAALEGGEDARAFASGMAASHALIMGRLRQGDHMVMSEVSYVGTAELARDTLPRFGIEVSMVDTSDPEAVLAALRPNTRMLWLETPANPIMRLSDIATLSDIAHAAGVRDVVVDSTFSSPIGCRPLRLGADFVIHSLTKYIGGHGDAMGGAVIGRKQELEALSMEAMVHYGGVISPFNAWLIMRGAATLPLRMQAHERAALDVAAFLEAHAKVKRVIYPGLASHPQHDLARVQLTNFSGMMTFQTHEGGHVVATRMIERLRHVHYAVSLGHHRSLVCWIATDQIMKSTYRLDATAEQRYRDYAGDGIFRLSVGIEAAQDICADLDSVLVC